MRTRASLLALVLAGLGAAHCKTDGETMVKGDGDAVNAGSSLDQATNEYLQQWKQSPKQTMNQLPVKRDASGVEQEQPFSRQDSNNLVVRDEVRIEIMCNDAANKDQCRAKQRAQGGQAPSAANDDASDLVDNGASHLDTLEAMETQNLKKAKLDASPWSDYYWAIYEGILGFRYGDPSWPGGSNWKKKSDYAAATPLKTVLSSGDAAAIDKLSPGEKFDLVIGASGDANGVGALTADMWSQGRGYADAEGNVETWMGICHGWAPGAYMMPRPAKTIEVMDFTNTVKVKFYPSDLKALGSLLWATGRSGTKFIGSRCNDKDAAQDENGRIKDTVCFDNNPGTWHKSVVNQIGVSRRSFVIDATYDYQVWNQPVYSYEYTYFNPQTLQAVDSIEKAKVAMPFATDKFKSYRATNAASVVGIAMRLAYVVETHPNRRTEDSPQHDSITTVDYRYDLELDANGKIIGGEWYTNAHPDFLWTPGPGGTARTWGDSSATGEWTGNGPIPASWATAAKSDAAGGTPLGKLVYALYQRAQ